MIAGDNHLAASCTANTMQIYLTSKGPMSDTCFQGFKRLAILLLVNMFFFFFLFSFFYLFSHLSLGKFLKRLRFQFRQGGRLRLVCVCVREEW